MTPLAAYLESISLDKYIEGRVLPDEQGRRCALGWIGAFLGLKDQTRQTEIQDNIIAHFGEYFAWINYDYLFVTVGPEAAKEFAVTWATERGK